MCFEREQALNKTSSQFAAGFITKRLFARLLWSLISSCNITSCASKPHHHCWFHWKYSTTFFISDPQASQVMFSAKATSHMSYISLVEQLKYSCWTEITLEALWDKLHRCNMTGLHSEIEDKGRWSWRLGGEPLNNLIQYWHFDIF